jgi:hypothetical protein
MKREPHAEHARLRAPAREQIFILAALQRKASATDHALSGSVKVLAFG